MGYEQLHAVIAWAISGALAAMLWLKSLKLRREKHRRSFYQSQVATLQEHARFLGRIAVQRPSEPPSDEQPPPPPRYERDVLP